MSKNRKNDAPGRDDLILRALEDIRAGQAEILARQGSIMGALPLLSAFRNDRDLGRALAEERAQSLEKGKEFWKRRKGGRTSQARDKRRE